MQINTFLRQPYLFFLNTTTTTPAITATPPIIASNHLGIVNKRAHTKAQRIWNLHFNFITISTICIQINKKKLNPVVVSTSFVLFFKPSVCRLVWISSLRQPYFFFHNNTGNYECANSARSEHRLLCAVWLFFYINVNILF